MNKTQQYKAELDKVNKDIFSLKDRREKLNAKLQEVDQRVINLTEEIGADLLADRDPSKKNAELQSKQAEVKGIESAINQADSQLNDLTREQDDLQKGIKHLEFNRVFETFEVKLTDTISSLYQAAAGIKALDDIRGELIQTGVHLDHASDQQNTLMSVYRAIGGNAASGKNDFYLQLENIENSFPLIRPLVARAKEKKSGR